MIHYIFGLLIGLCMFLVPYTSAQNTAPSNYDKILENTTDSVRSVVQSDLVAQRGENAVNTLIFRIINNIVIPLMIFAGIFLGIIGFYQMMVSNEDSAISTGRNYLIGGSVGTVTMIGARYISYIVWQNMFTQGLNRTLSGIDLSQQVYSQLIYPFLKIGMYVVIGVLFLVVIIQSYKYITTEEGESQGTIRDVIIANMVGILIIIGSKEIVELVYGKRDAILNGGFSRFSQIGGALISERDIPLYFQVINWTIGLVVVVILIFLVIQGFKLLFNPQSDESIEQTKTYVLYAFLGVLVIGTCYVLTNALIIN